jgi:hypothetical protein
MNNMKIEAKLDITNIEQWGYQWYDENNQSMLLKELKDDMKRAIAERCGINPADIKLTLSISLD